jgi:hypothetical protein
MARRVNFKLAVRVTHIFAPDSERRLSRAVSLLLAAARPDDDSVSNIEIKNQGKAPASNEYQGDPSDTGR